jgi:hypothetical protein
VPPAPFLIFRISHSNFDSTELVAGRIPDTLYPVAYMKLH